MTHLPEHRIAIVDDDSAVRDSLRLLMESHELTADTFESAIAFLEAGASYDCLVADLHMPGKTGLEMIEDLRLKGDATPVVLITGMADALLALRIHRANVLAVLTKPFAHDQLLGWVRQALDGHTEA